MRLKEAASVCCWFLASHCFDLTKSGPAPCILEVSFRSHPLQRILGFVLESVYPFLLAGASPSSLLGFWVALHLIPGPHISPSWSRTYQCAVWLWHTTCLGLILLSPRWKSSPAQGSPGSRDPVQVLGSWESPLGQEKVVTE